MANDNAADVLPPGNWPQLRSGPLMAGGILMAIGAVIASAGLAVVAAHVAVATRAWMQELETPPDQLAKLRWEQAKTAMAAGASSYRDHPNAQVRLRRTPNGATAASY